MLERFLKGEGTILEVVLAARHVLTSSWIQWSSERCGLLFVKCLCGDLQLISILERSEASQ